MYIYVREGGVGGGEVNPPCRTRILFGGKEQKYTYSLHATEHWISSSGMDHLARHRLNLPYPTNI